MAEAIYQTPFWFWVAAVFTFGLLLGSFANVIIYRMPLDQSVVKPRSRCPKCAKMIAWYDNIPVISWIILGAKCRACKTPISGRYPLVELIMGGLFAAVFYRFGFTWFTLEILIFTFAVITASFIDLDHMILPDEFTLSGIVIALAGAALNPERDFLPALLGVLMGGGFLWLVAYVYFAIRKQEGMGGGDIKLLAWIGALLGWQSIPFVILASSLVGSVVGLIITWRSEAGLKASIPFGPYLAAAALLYLFGGQAIGQWYLDVFLPGLGTPN